LHFVFAVFLVVNREGTLTDWRSSGKRYSIFKHTYFTSAQEYRYDRAISKKHFQLQARILRTDSDWDLIVDPNIKREHQM
jgi:hypothetical protein